MCLVVRLGSSNTWPSTFVLGLIKVICLIKGVNDIIKAIRLMVGGFY